MKPLLSKDLYSWKSVGPVVEAAKLANMPVEEYYEKHILGNEYAAKLEERLAKCKTQKDEDNAEKNLDFWYLCKLNAFHGVLNDWRRFRRYAEVITADPDLTSQEIADRFSLPLLYVQQTVFPDVLEVFGAQTNGYYRYRSFRKHPRREEAHQEPDQERDQSVPQEQVRGSGDGDGRGDPGPF